MRSGSRGVNSYCVFRISQRVREQTFGSNSKPAATDRARMSTCEFTEYVIRNTMTIHAADIYPLRLPMRSAFHISRGAVGTLEEGAPHVYVRVTADDGTEGWGEARPSPRWGSETQESVVTTLRFYLLPAVMGADPGDLDELHDRMEREIAPGVSVGQPIAKSAVDMAAMDLSSRSRREPLLPSTGGDRPSSWPVGYIISADSPEAAALKAREAAVAGFDCLKVKIGKTPAEDARLLRAVRREAPDAFIWADANQAYGLDDSLSLARQSAEAGADMLEQPMPANRYSEFGRLRHGSPIPIALDESIYCAEDIRQLDNLDAMDAVVLKVSKMAGPSRTLQCVRASQELGLGLLGSGLTESRLGFHASLALYFHTGIMHCDLNGPQFLLDDPISGPPLALKPVWEIAGGPAIGVLVDPEKLEKYRDRRYPGEWLHVEA